MAAWKRCCSLAKAASLRPPRGQSWKGAPSTAQRTKEMLEAGGLRDRQGRPVWVIRVPEVLGCFPMKEGAATRSNVQEDITAVVKALCLQRYDEKNWNLDAVLLVYITGMPGLQSHHESCSGGQAPRQEDLPLLQWCWEAVLETLPGTFRVMVCAHTEWEGKEASKKLNVGVLGKVEVYTLSTWAEMLRKVLSDPCDLRQLC
mmetsp:Transcript_58771/g.170040  ORF Transcript_58771/g.170040 Transcript_58771/m.170040 type:complete len:202 (+) Transcript_58771:1496-2101(+)